MLVEILAEDLEGAKYNEPKQCAIARALRRMGHPYAGCGSNVFWLDAAAPWPFGVYTLPLKAQQLSLGKIREPMTFEAQAWLELENQKL